MGIPEFFFIDPRAKEPAGAGCFWPLGAGVGAA